MTLLNWSPLYAGLDGLRTGLTKTIDWFQILQSSCYKSQIIISNSMLAKKLFEDMSNILGTA